MDLDSSSASLVFVDGAILLEVSIRFVEWLESNDRVLGNCMARQKESLEKCF